MSVTKEASGRRSVQVEVEVPGTPEEVWAAVATGPGISSWFVPAEFEARDGTPVALSLTEPIARTEALFNFLNEARGQGMNIRTPDFHRITDGFARGERLEAELLGSSIALAAPDEVHAGLRGEPADDRPPPHLDLRHEVHDPADLVPARPAHHERVDIGAVVAHQDEGPASWQVLDSLDARTPQQA